MRRTGRAQRGAFTVLAAVLAGVALAACGGSSNASSATKSASSKNAASTTTTRSGAAAGRTAFTACLKKHGVTLPRGGFGFRHGTTTSGAPPTGTRPSGGSPGGGYFGGRGHGKAGGFPGGGHGFPGGQNGFPGGGQGFAGGNSKFAKAFQACRSKLGDSGFDSGRFGNPGPGAGRFGNSGIGAGHFGGHGAPQFSAAVLKSYVACIRKHGDSAMPEPDTSSKARSPFPASAEKNPKFAAANAKCERVLFRGFRRPAAPGQSTTPATPATPTTSASTNA